MIHRDSPMKEKTANKKFKPTPGSAVLRAITTAAA